MNAFDAARSGTGDTGLALLFAATTTPAGGQAAQSTPFAQLLDQLNALPMPQGNAQVPAIMAGFEGAEPKLSASPVQQLRPPVGKFAQALAQTEYAAKPGYELRLPDTGKILPPTVQGGTALPAEAAVEVLPGKERAMIAELPVTERPIAEGISQSSSPPVIQLINAAMQVPVTVSAVPIRSAGSGAFRPRQAVTDNEAPQTSAAPAVNPAPAVSLTVADAPVAVGGEAPAAWEHVPREAVAASAPARPAMPLTADLHPVAGFADPVAVAPQFAAGPQQPAMQDLTQIVERLAAAREAIVPAATELAVEHAEFGPLSLSIRQGDRGELAVAVAAADRDSQAALVAAIAQGEAPGFEQVPDRRGGESAQRDPAGTGGEQRGQGTQRDRSAAQQQRQVTQPQREPARDGSGETRSGTYA